MLNASHPEEPIDDTEVEITDLDAPGEAPVGYTRLGVLIPPKARIWLGMVSIISLALIVLLILTAVLHAPQKAAQRTVLTPPDNQLSLSVVDGVAYASLPDATVTALRVSGGSVLWHHKGGNGVMGSTAIADGKVYVASLTVSGGGLQLIVNALRSDNGTLIWTRTFPVDYTISLQLTAFNGVVYVNTGDNGITALRANDGSPLWRYISPIPFSLMPYVADGIIYMGTKDGHVYALSARDGSLLWKYTSLIPPSPALPVISNGSIYINPEDHSMDALRTSDGTLLWHYPLQSFLTGTSPGIEDGALYVGTLDGVINSLRDKDGTLLWHASVRASTVFPIMNVADKGVYVATQDGGVDVLRADNGSLLWHYRDGNGNAALTTVANGVAYIISQVNDTDSIAALNSSNGTLLWHKTLSVPISSSPIVTDSMVLLALQDGSVEAFQAKNGNLLWQTPMQ